MFLKAKKLKTAKKRKKGLSLVIEYLLITLVSVSLLAIAKIGFDSLFYKLEKRKKIQEFKEFCIDFNFYLKNLDKKGLYYFPIKVKFVNNKVYLVEDKNFFCKLDFKICDKTIFGDRIVYYDDEKKEFCFE